MTPDEKWMRRALALAERGRGRVSPNPMVGAVLVRNGRVIAEGFHPKFGHAHAEVEALRKAGARAKGSTLYVNLEPCAHWGKTPPCAKALIEAGVKRVVAAMRDPNPLVAGKGFAALKRQGISLTVGLLEAEARHLNRAFVTWMKKNRPYVTLKVASSLDGRTSTIGGESQWITSDVSRAAGHRLRAQCDAIAVGFNTVRRDNPTLSAHGQGHPPVRVIFDSRLRSSLKARIFKKDIPTWCLTTDHALLKQIDQFKRKEVQVLLCHSDAQGRVAIKDALRRLAGRGITHLLVEGGMTLQQSFLEAGLVDDVVWFIAPMIIGTVKRLKDAPRLIDMEFKKSGPDLQVSACLPESSRRSAK